MLVKKTMRAMAGITATFAMTDCAFAQSDDTIVNDGEELIINEILESNLTISPDGRVSGFGAVLGDVSNDGVISPGPETNDFTIFGNFEQSDSGQLELSIFSSGDNGALTVFGASSINGSVIITPTIDQDAFTIGTTHTLVNSLGTTAGNLNLFISNDLLSRALIRPTLINSENGLVLSLEELSFVSAGFNSNQNAIATALDNTLGNSRGSLTEFTVDLGQVSIDNTAPILDQLIPDAAATLSTVAIRSSQLFHNEINSQIRNNINDRTQDNWRSWASAFGGFGDNSPDHLDGRTFDYDLYGVAVGTERTIGKNGLFGVALSVSQGDLDTEITDQNGEHKALFGSIYGAYKSENIRVNGVVGAGYSDFETSRRVVFAEDNPLLTSNFDGYTLSGSLELSYFKKYGDWQLESFAASDVHSSKQGSFTETGGGTLGFDLNSKTDTSFRTKIGGRIGLWGQANKKGFSPELSAAWVHEFSYDENRISGQFSDLPDSQFTIFGAVPAEDFLEVNAGFDYVVADQVSLFAKYNGLISSNENVHGVSAGIRITW